MISKEEVRQAIQDLKVRKAAGPSSVTGEMIKAAGEQAVDWMTSICNRIVKEEAIPESWQMSELVSIYEVWLKSNGTASIKHLFRNLNIKH